MRSYFLFFVTYEVMTAQAVVTLSDVVNACAQPGRPTYLGSDGLPGGRARGQIDL